MESRAARKGREGGPQRRGDEDGAGDALYSSQRPRWPGNGTVRAAAWRKSSEHELWIKKEKTKTKTNHTSAPDNFPAEPPHHDMPSASPRAVAKDSTSSCFVFKEQRVTVLGLVLKSKKNSHAKLTTFPNPPLPPVDCCLLCFSSTDDKS